MRACAYRTKPAPFYSDHHRVHTKPFTSKPFTPAQVNIQSGVRRRITAEVEAATAEVFDEAAEQIFRLMERDTFARFKQVQSRMERDTFARFKAGAKPDVQEGAKPDGARHVREVQSRCKAGGSRRCKAG